MAMKRGVRLGLVLLATWMATSAYGQVSDSAAIYVIKRAFLFTKSDTIDVSKNFLADTSAVVIATEGRDTSYFTISNLQSKQICVGEVLREAIPLQDGVVTYSGRFVCDLGRVVTGNHLFITEQAVERYNGADSLFIVDIIFDQPISLRFITDKIKGVISHSPIASTGADL